MVKSRKQKGGQEKIYQVTMPLRFEKANHDLRDIEKKQNEDALEFCQKVQLFREAEQQFSTAESIESHIKSQDPNTFVKYLVNGEEFDAHWNPDRFEISFKVRSEEPLEEFRRGIALISLADGQWESSDDNGWTVKTGPTVPQEGNRYGSIRYEYGLTDFDPRSVRVEVVGNPNNNATTFQNNKEGGTRKTRKTRKSKQTNRK